MHAIRLQTEQERRDKPSADRMETVTNVGNFSALLHNRFGLDSYERVVMTGDGRNRYTFVTLLTFLR